MKERKGDVIGVTGDGRVREEGRRRCQSFEKPGEGQSDCLFPQSYKLSPFQLYWPLIFSNILIHFFWLTVSFACDAVFLALL